VRSSARLGQQLLLVVLDVLFEVFLHGSLVDEFLLALGVGTAVGPLARVCAYVLVQDGLLPEALGALRTHVRLLARVDPDVLVQNRLLPKRLIAIRTTEGPFIRMYPQVLDEMRLLHVTLSYNQF